MNSDGTGQTNLSNHPGDDLNPCPSPDGERILFKSNRDDSQGKHSLYTVRPDGSDLTLFGGSWVNGYSCEGWSPDSSSFVFSEYTGNGNGKVLANNVTVADTTNYGYRAPVWNKQTNKITYIPVAAGGIKNVGIPVTSPQPWGIWPAHVSLDQASWSPDGTKLVFRGQGVGVTDPPSNYEIFVGYPGQYALGVTPTKITDYAGRDTSPAWKPSGDQLVFSRDGKLHLMNSDGSGVVALNEGYAYSDQPNWAPDGLRLVYDCNTGSGWSDVCIINSDGTGKTRLTFLPTSQDSTPRFVP